MNLRVFRMRIDALDRQLVRLLDQRAEWVMSINRMKKSKKMPRRIPSREREVFQNILRASRGKFPRRALRQIYQRLLLSSYRLGAKKRSLSR
jgi:chorismate mutase